jgi:hypothetical protein
MRYILEGCSGEPPKVKPVGMNDILGIGVYVSPHNALKFMQRAHNEQWLTKRYTHLAVYTFPHGYAKDCELVLAVKTGDLK